MALITNLIGGPDREYFDLFERAGANVERAGDLLDEMLAGFPDTWGAAARHTSAVSDRGRGVSRSRDSAGSRYEFIRHGRCGWACLATG